MNQIFLDIKDAIFGTDASTSKIDAALSRGDREVAIQLNSMQKEINELRAESRAWKSAHKALCNAIAGAKFDG